MKTIYPKHITNITYQDFHEAYYYISYPKIKPFLYGINVFGDVISLNKNREKPRKAEFDRSGYLSMKLRTDDGNTIKVMVSRLVAWEFVGHPEDFKDLQVNHADGLVFNNYYQNLEWVTSEENIIHKTLYKLCASEEKHGENQHKKKVVKFIIKLIEEGQDAPEISRIVLDKYPNLYSSKDKTDYDRIRNLISKINRGVSWSNLKDKIKGSTTIENIIYEKHIGEEVSRVGLNPIPVRNDGRLIFGKRE